MTTKQPIKLSEAKILVYLNQVHLRHKYIAKIASKLQMDYVYCLRILKQMNEKGWIRKEQSRTKSFYLNTNNSPIQKAKELISK